MQSVLEKGIVIPVKVGITGLQKGFGLCIFMMKMGFFILKESNGMKLCGIKDGR